MRDRLIELVKESSQYIKEQDLLIDRIADYLLENGVIVPPCKVGDVVYTIPRKAIRKWKVVGIWLSADDSQNYMNIAWYRDKDTFMTISVDFDEIGKTVFLTKAEAERALQRKEDEKNG